jgi:uncharacterized membrane protein
MNPAMIVVIFSGSALINVYGLTWLKNSPWLHAKLALVLLLI